MTDDRLLDAHEIAALLNVPVSWVREHTLNGDIPHLKLGRYRRYRRTDILDWIEKQAQGGQGAGGRSLREPPR